MSSFGSPLREAIKITRVPLFRDDHGFMPGTPEERFKATWQLTGEAFTLAGNPHVKQRLQRHITRLIKK